MDTSGTVASETATNFLTGFWSAVPSILWFGLLLVCLFVLRKELRSLLQNLSWRLRTGAPVKFFSIELGESYVSPSIDVSLAESAVGQRIDEDAERWEERRRYYEPQSKSTLGSPPGPVQDSAHAL